MLEAFPVAQTVAEERPSPEHARGRRFGTIAVLLSGALPGLGQAYLRDLKKAAIFFAPAGIALVAIGLALLGTSGLIQLATRFLDPTVAFSVAAIVAVFAMWWVASIVHAWYASRSPTFVAALSAVLVASIVGGVGGWATVSLLRLGNAGIDIATGDPLDPASNPHLRPGLGSATDADPHGRPPADLAYSEDEVPGDLVPDIHAGPSPGFAFPSDQDDGYTNVLLTGVDWAAGRIGARTDTMLVVSVNDETGEVLMFSFPRDLQWFPIYSGGTFTGKLNSFAGMTTLYPEQFPEPGLPSLAHQLGFMLGLAIDYYASVDMTGFMRVVESVGGVTVCNRQRIADDHLQFYLEPGQHRLDPDDALRYVRSRKGPSSGDFARAGRQQELLGALKREMLRPANVPRISEIAQALASVVTTNYPTNQLDQLFTLAEQVEDEPSRAWVFRQPEWAEFVTSAETHGRQVLSPRLDKTAALSRQLFGDRSLYWTGTVVDDEAVEELPPPTIESEYRC